MPTTEETKPSIRVIIADDHIFYREGIRTILEQSHLFEVVGEASNGNDVISLTSRMQPDVILMDVKMPGLNGIEATRMILSDHPNVGILIVTMFEEDESVFSSMRAGARGYILKDADRDELMQSIMAVHTGQAIFSPPIAKRLIHYFSTMGAGLPKPDPIRFPELTEREREVLDLIGEGFNNDGIAHRLVISKKTVQNHISNIFNKLQIADRSQAIILAREKK